MEHLDTYIAFDLEFMDLGESYELLQVSGVKFSGEEELAHFDSYVYTDKPLKSFINGLTGITSDKIASAPQAEEVVAAFAAFVGDTPLIGYNSQKSDLPILESHGLALSNQYQVDLYDEAFERRSTDLNGIDRLSLKSVADFLGIKGRGHNSLEDARMTAQVYQAFMEQDRNKALLQEQASESISNNPFAGLGLAGLFED